MQQDPNNSNLQNTKISEEVISNKTYSSATQNADTVDKIIQLIWFLTGFINVILVLRIIFLLLNAQISGFSAFLFNFTSIFSMPFYGIFPAPIEGKTYFDTAALVAIVIYSLVAWGIVTLVRIVADKKEVA